MSTRGVLLLAASAVFGASMHAAAPERSVIVTSQDHSLVAPDDCDHFHTTNTTSFPSQVRAQEQRQVPIAGVDLLKVRASDEGGVSIKGWDRPIVRLTVCKYAVGLTEAEAKKTLAGVKVTVQNGEVAAYGPEASQRHAWWVHMILRVPKSAHLDVASNNGGIAIRNMSGRIAARSTNGGISLASSGGDHKLSTENGGISLDKVSGKVEANTQNGSISLKIRNVTVPSLEARVESDGEIVCRVKGCDDEGIWNSNRTVLRLGGGAPPAIRLSTAGAPIVIEQLR